MGIFSRGPKPIRGRVADKTTGIYVELPSHWNAYQAGDMYLLGAIKEKGALTFNVDSYLDMPPGFDINSDIGKRAMRTHPIEGIEIETEITKQGDFTVWYLPSKDYKRDMTFFYTDTEKYLICFIYMGSKKQFEEEKDDVWKVLNSLVKYPNGKT